MKTIKKLTAVFMAVLMLAATVPFFNAFAADGESVEDVVLEIVKTNQDNNYVTVQVNVVSGYFEAMDFQFIMSDGVTCDQISAYGGIGMVNNTNGKVSMVSVDGYTAGTVLSATFSVPSDDIFTITGQASCYIAADDNDTQSVNTIINGAVKGKEYLNDTVYYTFDQSTGTVTIGGTGDMPDYSSDNRSPFYNDTSIKNVIIEEGVTSVGNSAFEGCQSLASVTIPDSVTGIGDYAFSDCDILTSITIPDTVTSISEYAFNSCDSLTDVYYNGYKEQWDKIEIDRGNDSLLNANIHFLEPQIQPTGKIEKVYIPDTDVYYKSTAKIVPQISIDGEADYTVKYESSNPSVATVDKNGNISTVHKGSTTVTCTVTDEYGNTVKDTCTVNVKFRWWQWLIWILLLGFLWY